MQVVTDFSLYFLWWSAHINTTASLVVWTQFLTYEITVGQDQTSSHCQYDEFICDEIKCLNLRKRCDDYRDCEDLTDEDDCYQTYNTGNNRENSMQENSLICLFG